MTTAKAVQVSADDGATWYTLPGSSGSWDDDADNLDDTIFGHTFKSGQTGLIGWTAAAQAFYKGFAGYVASIKQPGTTTAFNAEAATHVSGLIYQITATAKRVFDRATPVVIWDNGSPVSGANIESIDYLFGKVTFVAGYSVLGTITFHSGNYFPMVEIAKANTFTLTQNADTKNTSDFATAHGNNGYKTFDPGLRTVSLEVGGFYAASSAFWEVLEGRDELILEINPDGSGLSLARGFFKMLTRKQSGNVGAIEEENRSFTLAVPENIDVIFSWAHDPSTTLSQAIRILLDAYLGETKPLVRYLPDGTDDQIGFQGSAVITDLSLAGGVDKMNEFTVAFMGDDAPTRGVMSD